MTETSKEDLKKTINVKATRLGYYDHVRKYPGEKFVLKAVKTIKHGQEVVISAEQQFSKHWMERLDVESKPSQRPSNKPPVNTKPVETETDTPPATGDGEVI